MILSNNQGLQGTNNPFKPKNLSVIIIPFDSGRVQKKTINKKESRTKKNLAFRSKENVSANIQERLKDPQVIKNAEQKPVHNLRRLKVANYNENSLNSPEEIPIKKHVPIYKINLPENEQPPTNPEHLYDFTDTSPKMKKVIRNERRSSILFDKNTFEILQKIQAKERKCLKKQKNTYKATVSKIMSNMKQQVLKKTRNRIQPQLNETRSNSSVVHVTNVNNEFNTEVHILSKAKKMEEASPTDQCSEVSKSVANQNTDDLSPVRNKSLNTQDLIMLQSISSCDNSLILKDLESGFGFNIDPPSPAASTPVQQKIKVLSNKLLRKPNKELIQSPLSFHTENPKANSTMVQVEANPSPWRTNWINVRRNPHLVNFKANALPAINQEMVLDHSIVDNYERHCCKTPKPNCSPIRKTFIQKSIVDFVESNIDKENENLQCSLYDSEAFNSPEKKFQVQQRCKQSAKRKVLGDRNNISLQPNILSDTGPVIDETKNTTYFGFEQTTTFPSPKKGPKNNKAKPSRFDVSQLKKYTRKKRHLEPLPPREDPELTHDVTESESIFENSNEEDAGEIHLFEEPEEMLNNMEFSNQEDKTSRRKRLHSLEMDGDDQTKRKTKKTKLEIEQEAWIREFNEMCEKIDGSALEIE